MKFLKSKRNILLIIITLAFIILLFSLLKEKATNQFPPYQPPDQEKFQLINVSPPSGEQNFVMSQTAISFTFSLPLDDASVNIQSQPFIDLNYSTNPSRKSLHITPENMWPRGKKYVLTINANSLDGQGLSEPITYVLQVKKVTEIPAME